MYKLSNPCTKIISTLYLFLHIYLISAFMHCSHQIQYFNIPATSQSLLLWWKLYKTLAGIFRGDIVTLTIMFILMEIQVNCGYLGENAFLEMAWTKGNNAIYRYIVDIIPYVWDPHYKVKTPLIWVCNIFAADVTQCLKLTDTAGVEIVYQMTVCN